MYIRWSDLFFASEPPKPIQNAILTAQMEAYYEAMNWVRFFGDWLFGDILNYFKFLDFKKNFKLRYMPQMEAYNEAMSSVRSSVEWLFGDTVNYFKF